MIEQLQALLGNDMLRLHLSAVVLGMIRIGAFATIAPLLGPGVTSPVRFPIILALYLPLHPCMVETVRVLGTSTTMDMIMLLLIIGKEVLLGVFMGWLVSLFFYIALSAGTIVDNQRGASMAQTADLLSGAEASPLGSLLFMAAVTLFFVSGSFILPAAGSGNPENRHIRCRQCDLDDEADNAYRSPIHGGGPDLRRVPGTHQPVRPPAERVHPVHAHKERGMLPAGDLLLHTLPVPQQRKL